MVPGNGTPTTPPAAASKLGGGAAELVATLEARNPYRGKTPATAEEEASQEAEQRAAAQRFEQREREEWLRSLQGGLGKRYAAATLGNFQADTREQKAVVEALQDYAANLSAEVEAGNGLVLYGPSGTGKDHLLAGLAKVAIVQHGRQVRWQGGLDLYGELRDRMDRQCETEGALVRHLVYPAILILSDPLPPSGPLTQFQAATLLRVLDSRYRKLRVTWVSLNVASGAEADERLGSPLVDRLRHGSLMCCCNWPSFRRGRSVGVTGQPK